MKFWYHHPAARAPSGIEFLQTPEGKLYWRVGRDGKYDSRGEVRKDDRVTLPGGLQVVLAGHLPAARYEAAFYPIELGPGESEGPEPAVLVHVVEIGVHPGKPHQ